jgi:hypothetical protein
LSLGGITGEWRKLHNEEFNDLHSPSTIQVIKTRRMRWFGHVACRWERRGVYRDLVEKTEGKIPLGMPRHIWGDNIKMDPQDGRIILRWIFRKWDEGAWTE